MHNAIVEDFEFVTRILIHLFAIALIFALLYRDVVWRWILRLTR
jgi:uncharacterized membrane protein